MTTESLPPLPTDAMLDGLLAAHHALAPLADPDTDAPNRALAWLEVAIVQRTAGHTAAATALEALAEWISTALVVRSAGHRFLTVARDHGYLPTDGPTAAFDVDAFLVAVLDPSVPMSRS